LPQDRIVQLVGAGILVAIATALIISGLAIYMDDVWMMAGFLLAALVLIVLAYAMSMGLNLSSFKFGFGKDKNVALDFERRLAPDVIQPRKLDENEKLEGGVQKRTSKRSSASRAECPAIQLAIAVESRG